VNKKQPNKGVIRKWVKALRSGKYKQSRGYLMQQYATNKNSHCCLGVLCELALEKGIVTRSKEPLGIFRYDQARYILPVAVAKWAGIEAVPRLSNAGSLTTLNDRLLYDFNQIADVIEEEWLNN